MRSTARFLEATLLGVALGVGLGFLVCRRGGQRGLKDLWPPISEPVPSQGPILAPPPEPEIGGEVPGSAGVLEQEIATAGLGADSEIQVSPEVLEEPLAGWESSAASVGEEEVTEEMPPIPSEVEAYTSVEVEPLDAEGIPVWADVPVPEVEVEPDAERAVEELLAEDVIISEAAGEEARGEGTSVEERIPEEAVTDDWAAEEAVEESVVEESVVEESVVEEVEIETVPIPAPADDLKARIEETRKRIRRELEQPFIIGGAAGAADTIESSEAEPAIGEALAVEPLPEEPGLDTQESAVSQAGESGLSSVAEAEERPLEAEGEASEVDYEAMRSRIEETRSRLKAKAFDAMMTGESALLGRDSDGANDTLPAPTEVDGEIVQTIDETLREEET